MKLWYFTEQQYHPGWEQVSGPIRNTPPTDVIDPVVAADLFDRYYEEFAVADELGLGIAVNEHHTSLQCMSPATLLSVAAIARTTSRARILSIGTPIAQRPDPVRVAEEIALTDMLSRGRTEVGLIKSVPWEYFNSNANPVGVTERFWEAHDLILKALTTRHGPFAWHGEHFHYRNINVVPRPYQDPHPPIWMTGQSPSSARTIATRGHVGVTSQSGARDAAPFFAAYRDEYEKVHNAPPTVDRLGYLCYMAVASTETKAADVAQRIHKWVEYLGSQHPGFQHAAGYAPAGDFARMMRAGQGNIGVFSGYRAPSIAKLRDDGVMFFGTPRQVCDQVRTFMDRVGPIGHLLVQMGGYATQTDTVESLALMAEQLHPMLEEFSTRQP
jgi:alkanesulfonate monooxygenase SsuD/methylene tetrahydromethanopterin reductase-like flavin-dependent oxidoreductase (luciferase family)